MNSAASTSFSSSSTATATSTAPCSSKKKQQRHGGIGGGGTVRTSNSKLQSPQFPRSLSCASSWRLSLPQKGGLGRVLLWTGLFGLSFWSVERTNSRMMLSLVENDPPQLEVLHGLFRRDIAEKRQQQQHLESSSSPDIALRDTSSDAVTTVTSATLNEQESYVPLTSDEHVDTDASLRIATTTTQSSETTTNIQNITNDEDDYNGGVDDDHEYPHQPPSSNAATFNDGDQSSAVAPPLQRVGFRYGRGGGDTLASSSSSSGSNIAHITLPSTEDGGMNGDADPSDGGVAAVDPTATTPSIEQLSPSTNPIAVAANVVSKATIEQEYDYKFSNDDVNGSDSNDSSSNDTVIEWKGLDDMNAFVESIWSGNLFCQTMQEERERQQQEIASNNLTENDSVQYTGITLKLRFGCQDLFRHSDSGTGNFIMAIYMMRLSAVYLGNITLDMACPDAEQTKTDLILPWLTSRRTVPADPVRHEQLLQAWRQHVWELDNFACQRFTTTPLGLMHREMQFDLRKMAVALVGTIPNHPSTDFAERYLYTSDSTEDGTNQTDATVTNNDMTELAQLWRSGDLWWNATSSIVPQLDHPTRTDRPLSPQFENVTNHHDDLLDDAVIHFRCGDLLSTDLQSYGFMRFSGYVRHISPEARSIGILTQPFGDEEASDRATTASAESSASGEQAQPQQQRRQHDSGAETSRRCRILVTALQDYIQERHPQATVRIRNDPSETIALTYARIIMANQSVAAMSTFSIFPIVATFGTGYFLRPEPSHPSVWLRNYNDMRDQATGRTNVVLFDMDDPDAVRVGAATRNAWDEQNDDAILQWFRS